MLRRLDLQMPELRSLDLRPLATSPELRGLGITAQRLARVELGRTAGFEGLTHLALLGSTALERLDLSALAPGRFLRHIVVPRHLRGAVDLSKLPAPTKKFEIEFR